MPNNNPWSPWLEETPGALFQAMIPAGVSPTFGDYWQRQQSRVSNQYMGALGKQVLGGQPPSLGFGEFLGDYPFQEYWNLMSPRNRGLNMGLAPSMQWRV